MIFKLKVIMKKKITKTHKKNEDFGALAKEFVQKAAGILDMRLAPNAISLHVSIFTQFCYRH